MNKVVIGDAELYLADCMDILPTLPMVDAVITDPPYSDYVHSNAKSNRGSSGHGISAIDFSAIDFSEISRLLNLLSGKCSGWIVATMAWQHICLINLQAGAEFELVRFGVWVKTNPMPQISSDRPAHGWDGIAYLYPRGKKKRWNGGGAHGNWIGPIVTNGDHPTGKPIAMIQQFVQRFTNLGEVVVDPFMGSGTTGVAAIQLGRKFIGIEKEPKYFEIACRRIEQAVDQGKLFSDEPIESMASQAELFEVGAV